MSNNETAAVRQSIGLVDFAKPLMDDLAPKIENLFTDEELNSFSRIIVTGNGDSYVAGMAAKAAFEALTKYYDIIAKPAIEVEHFSSRSAFRGTNLAIGVSISGHAGGTVKALKACKAKGAFTIGVTENPDSPLGQSVDRVLKHDAAEAELAPGTKTYFASIMTLLLLAIRMGVASGKISSAQAEELKGDILSYIESFKPIIDDLSKQTLALAEEFKDCTSFDCVGSGIDYASAWFTRAKIYEAVGLVTAVENTEDWCHVNYFNAKPSTTGSILFISKDSPAFNRAKELVRAFDMIKRPAIIITDACTSEFPEGSNVIKIPTAKKEWMKPIMQFVPGTMLFGYMQGIMGEKPLRGLEGPIWGPKDGNNIYYIDYMPPHSSGEDK